MSPYLHYGLLVGCGLLALVALIGAFSGFRLSRRASYFSIRRDATRRAWRWLVVLLLALAGIVATQIIARTGLLAPTGRLSQQVATLSQRPSRPTATLDLNALPSLTPNPSLTPKDPLAEPPTITPTQPTPTDTATPYIATAQTTITPQPDASITIWAISSGISSDLTPVEPGDTFPAGITRIYIFLRFRNMTDGLSWSQALLRNGVVVTTDDGLWQWGEEGDSAYFYFGAREGWPAGAYEVQFFLGDTLAASAAFELTNS